MKSVMFLPGVWISCCCLFCQPVNLAAFDFQKFHRFCLSGTAWDLASTHTFQGPGVWVEILQQIWGFLFVALSFLGFLLFTLRFLDRPWGCLVVLQVSKAVCFLSEL